MQDALQTALTRYATFVEAAEASSAVATVLAAAPDVVVLIGDAAGEKADAILHDLATNPMTSVVPVVLLAAEAGLERRLTAFRSGAVAVVPRTASVDQMARDVSRLARELQEHVDQVGEVGEATVDELVQILSKELRTGILSVSQEGATGGAGAARIVLRSGRPVQEAIAEFVQKIRPLVADAKPLQFEFLESPQARFSVLGGEAEQGDRTLLKGRRILLIENNPATADALAQELRAHKATVVVTDGEGVGFERAKALDPEVVLIAEEGLEGWGYQVMSRLRKDVQLRWASVLVVHWDQLFEAGQAPRMDRLAGSLEPLLAADREITARAAREAKFDTRLEVVGPTRLLRALVAAGQTVHLEVKNPRVVVDVDIAEGLIAGATAKETKPGAESVGGPAALAILLGVANGRVHVERKERPAVANLLSPVDDALAAASKELSSLRPSLLPPKPAAVRAPSHAPAAETAGAPGALVHELRELVTQLKTAMSVPPAPFDDDEGPTRIRSSSLPPPLPAGHAPSAVKVPAPAAVPRPAAASPGRARSQTMVGMGVAAPAAAPPPTAAAAPSAAAVPPPKVVVPPPKVAAQVGGRPKKPRQQTLVGVAAPTAAELEGAVAAPAPTPMFPPAAAPAPAPMFPPAAAPAPAAAHPELAGLPTDDSVAQTLPPPPEPAASPAAAPWPSPAGADHGPAGHGTSAPSGAAAAPFAATMHMEAVPLPVRPSQPEVRSQPPRRLESRHLLGAVAILLVVLIGILGYAVLGAPDDEPTPVAAGGPASGAPAAASAPAAAAPPAVEPTPTPAPPVVEPSAGEAAAAEEEASTEEPAMGEAEAAAEEAPDDEEALGADEAGAEEAGESGTAGRRRPADVLIAQGNTFRGRGQYPLAEQRYQRALRIEPYNGRAIAGLARTYLAQRNAAQAVRWSRKLVETRPNVAGNHVLYGDALALTGNTRGARRAYEKALEVDRRDRTARARLERMGVRPR